MGGLCPFDWLHSIAYGLLGLAANWANVVERSLGRLLVENMDVGHSFDWTAIEGSNRYRTITGSGSTVWVTADAAYSDLTASLPMLDAGAYGFSDCTMPA